MANDKKQPAVTTSENGRVTSSGMPVIDDPGLDEIAQQSISEKQQSELAEEVQNQKQAAATHKENVSGWLQAVEAAKELVCAPLPEAEPAWSKDRMEALAEALAKCDERYGWGGVAGLFAHPLVALALAAVPIAFGTAKAYNEAQKKKPVDVDANVVKPEKTEQAA